MYCILLTANMQQVLDWIEEYNREGIFCVWLGPTYPLVLIYKPDICEVRCGRILSNTGLVECKHFAKPTKRVFFTVIYFVLDFTEQLKTHHEGSRL